MTLGKILIVEDEEHLADVIKLNLKLEGYDVETESNGADADERLLEEEFQLVILDVMLPGMDGFEVCKRMRRRDDRTPVLFLTARKSAEDRIMGLNIGGDDYLLKPFNLKELLSRVHAILRRRAWLTADMGVEHVEFGSARIDVKKMEGVGPRGAVSLSRRECLILKLLAERDGEAVARNEILDRAWSKNQYPTDRTVDNFIMRLRQHFEDDPSAPKHILTVRGVGYRLLTD